MAPQKPSSATARRSFRLAMSDYGAMALLPGLLRAVRKIAPGIDLVVSQASREAMTAKVADGEIDLALGVFGQPPEGVRSTELFEETYACMVDAATVRGLGKLDQVAYLARSLWAATSTCERARYATWSSLPRPRTVAASTMQA